MKFSATFVSLVLAASSAVAQLTINTPSNVVVCQPLLISWSGGESPYFLSIHPGADPSGAAIVDFGQVTGNSLTWTVNQQANTQLDLTIKDSTGISAQSAPFTVEAGSDIACLNATASSTQSTAGNTSATSGAATSTSSSATNTAVVTTSTSAAQTTTTAPATTSSKATSSAASTTSSAKPATTSNAAATQAASFGAAVLGAAAVALFA